VAFYYSLNYSTLPFIIFDLDLGSALVLVDALNHTPMLLFSVEGFCLRLFPAVSRSSYILGLDFVCPVCPWLFLK